MARLLLILEVWKSRENKPIEAGRLAVVDFGLRFPTVVGKVVPSLKVVAGAYGLADEGLSELFSNRHYLDLRETVIGLTHGLHARSLAQEESVDLRGDVGYSITLDGTNTAAGMVSALSLGYRAMATELVLAWRHRSVAKIFQEIRDQIPTAASETSNLRKPFFIELEA